MLPFDLHYISKSKKSKNVTLSSFSNVIDCSGSLISLINNSIEYYSSDRQDDDYFNENKFHIQSILIELYKISPHTTELISINTPEPDEQPPEHKTLHFDHMIFKPKKHTIPRMFQKAPEERTPTPEEPIQINPVLSPEPSDKPLLSPDEPDKPLLSPDEPDKPLLSPDEPDKPLLSPDEPDKPLHSPDEPDEPDKPFLSPDEPDKPIKSKKSRKKKPSTNIISIDD
jgi:hypothetical protein